MNIKTVIICAFVACAAACQSQEQPAAEDESETNATIETIMARHSIRQYKDQPVSHDTLATLVECGINAPNGMNKQPWIIRVVEDKAFIDSTTAIYVKANAERVAADSTFKNMYRNAPNLICVATPKDGSGQVDAGMLGENIMIAAQSMGLGTCCLGGPVHFLLTTPECKPYIDRLNIPADYVLNFIIAVGYPDETPNAKPRDASKVEYIR